MLQHAVEQARNQSYPIIDDSGSRRRVDIDSPRRSSIGTPERMLTQPDQQDTIEDDNFNAGALNDIQGGHRNQETMVAEDLHVADSNDTTLERSPQPAPLENDLAANQEVDTSEVAIQQPLWTIQLPGASKESNTETQPVNQSVAANSQGAAGGEVSNTETPPLNQSVAAANSQGEVGSQSRHFTRSQGQAPAICPNYNNLRGVPGGGAGRALSSIDSVQRDTMQQQQGTSTSATAAGRSQNHRRQTEQNRESDANQGLSHSHTERGAGQGTTGGRHNGGSGQGHSVDRGTTVGGSSSATARHQAAGLPVAGGGRTSDSSPSPASPRAVQRNIAEDTNQESVGHSNQDLGLNLVRPEQAQMAQSSHLQESPTSVHDSPEMVLNNIGDRAPNASSNRVLHGSSQAGVHPRSHPDLGSESSPPHQRRRLSAVEPANALVNHAVPIINLAEEESPPPPCQRRQTTVLDEGNHLYGVEYMGNDEENSEAFQEAIMTSIVSRPTCTICQYQLDPETAAVSDNPDCNHMFHVPCAQTMTATHNLLTLPERKPNGFRRAGQCPVCRRYGRWHHRIQREGNSALVPVLGIAIFGYWATYNTRNGIRANGIMPILNPDHFDSLVLFLFPGPTDSYVTFLREKANNCLFQRQDFSRYIQEEDNSLDLEPLNRELHLGRRLWIVRQYLATLPVSRLGDQFRTHFENRVAELGVTEEIAEVDMSNCRWYLPSENLAKAIQDSTKSNCAWCQNRMGGVPIVFSPTCGHHFCANCMTIQLERHRLQVPLPEGSIKRHKFVRVGDCPICQTTCHVWRRRDNLEPLLGQPCCGYHASYEVGDLRPRKIQAIRSVRLWNCLVSHFLPRRQLQHIAVNVIDQMPEDIQEQAELIHPYLTQIDRVIYPQDLQCRQCQQRFPVAQICTSRNCSCRSRICVTCVQNVPRIDPHGDRRESSSVGQRRMLQIMRFLHCCGGRGYYEHVSNAADYNEQLIVMNMA
jgi:hypothetical protein